MVKGLKKNSNSKASRNCSQSKKNHFLFNSMSPTRIIVVELRQTTSSILLTIYLQLYILLKNNKKNKSSSFSTAETMLEQLSRTQ